jgi:transcriptional regulator with XRE-family HTH domain
MEISTKIDAIMKEKGFTDGDMSEITGLPRMTIGNARRGKNITLANALRISKALGKPLDEIWGLSKPESESESEIEHQQEEEVA